MTCHQTPVAKAAALAGMLPPATTVQARVARIAAEVAPAIAEAIRFEVDQLRRLQERQDARDREIDSACKAVGDAVDCLEQARHTSAEIPARRSLERAATRLRRVMRKGHVNAKR